MSRPTANGCTRAFGGLAANVAAAADGDAIVHTTNFRDCAARASTGPVAPPKVTTSAPVPVDPKADIVNISVIATSATAIIVSVLIDDRKITLEQATLARVPDRKRASRAKEGEAVTFEGMRGSEVVSSITVADQAINAEEQKGLVRLVKRGLQAAVPAPRALDSIRVTVHSNGASETLRLNPEVYKLCE